ncbi:MAG TPA: hypothetical protein VMF58_14365 [Rhizomicrobium sp.]|nr:hypothetical protein [Rhizomicrobium sp.]
MITGVEIGLGIKALKTAFDIAKEAKDLTDTTTMRSKIIEMQSLILEAQGTAIEARDAHSEQVDRIRALEAEVADLKAWDNEKARYELKTPHIGATIYALKPDKRDGEPPHWLCPNCYQQRKKRILQGTSGGHGAARWTCPDCKAYVVVSSGVAPQ